MKHDCPKDTELTTIGLVKKSLGQREKKMSF